MKTQYRSIRFISGVVTCTTVAALAVAWAPIWGIDGTPPSKKNCGCVLSESGLKDLHQGSAPIGEREWCITQQIYDAERIRGTDVSLMATCVPSGPPDDPAVRDAAIPTASTPIKRIRLYFNVFRENNGANPAATEADVANAVAWLNANYLSHRIQFNYGWRFVDSTRYRYLDRAAGEDVGMKNSYAVSPATQLNVYVVDTGGVCWGTFPFSSYALSKQGGIVMHYFYFRAATPLPSILTHEVGHCVGLWHVFHGTDEVTACSDCYEPAGRSAAVGDVTGDFCSDTNPTPKNSNNCFDPPGTDPCSGLPWVDTPFDNYMSYGNVCHTHFTPQQSGRMHSWTNQTLTGWLELPPPPNVPGAPLLTKNGSTIDLVWADNSSNEFGFEVQREKKGNGNRWGGTTTIANVAANMTSASDVPGAGTFRYRVRSYGEGGFSAYSAWTQITN